MSETVTEGYYRDPRFCLECAYTHARDVEHHLEDWHKFTSDEEQRKVADELRDKQRRIRKKIDEWRLKLGPLEEEELQTPQETFSSPVNTSGKSPPLEGGENPHNPIPAYCTFEKEQVKPKEYFDPRSFRTLCPECPDARCAKCPPELECATRIIVGCKAGEFKAGRCQIGTETHVIYHGTPKAK